MIIRGKFPRLLDNNIVYVCFVCLFVCFSSFSDLLIRVRKRSIKFLFRDASHLDLLELINIVNANPYAIDGSSVRRTK